MEGHRPVSQGVGVGRVKGDRLVEGQQTQLGQGPVAGGGQKPPPVSQQWRSGSTGIRTLEDNQARVQQLERCHHLTRPGQFVGHPLPQPAGDHQIANDRRGVEPVEHCQIFRGPSRVTFGESSGRPEDPGVRVGRVKGHRVVEVGPSRPGVTTTPGRPTPVGQSLYVRRLEFQHPVVDLHRLGWWDHQRLDKQAPRRGPDVAGKSIVTPPAASRPGKGQPGQHGQPDRPDQNTPSPGSGPKSLPPPNGQGQEPHRHSADHHGEHPHHPGQPRARRVVVDVGSEPGDQQGAHLVVADPIVDQDGDGGPNGSGHRNVGLGQRLAGADRAGEVLGQLADPVGIRQGRPVRGHRDGQGTGDGQGDGQPGQADYRGADWTAHPSAPARESSDSRSARSTPPATLAAT